jgi:hypothetical protein
MNPRIRRIEVLWSTESRHGKIVEMFLGAYKRGAATQNSKSRS